MKTLINPRISMLAIMILSAGALRLLISSGHTPLTNFTPIGAMALFGGCYFSDKWKAFLVPILTLWISDIVLNYFFYFHEWKLFYDGFFATYTSFAIFVILGRLIKKVNIKNVLSGSILAALTHYIITDLAVWLDGRLYPKTLDGLITCYVAAIPYLENMLVGNLLFGGIMFGAFELAQRKFPVLKQTQLI